MAAFVGLIGFASILSLGGYGLYEQMRYQHEAQDKASEYAELAAREIQQSCVRVAASEEAQCVADQQAEYELKARDNRREQDDLVAQRKSALWTFIMGMAALIGMVLSAIGVVLVKQTFDETKRTNRIAMRENARATRRTIASARDTEAALAVANRNAQTAADQVALSEATASRQLRAYLAPGEAFVDVFYKEDALWFKFDGTIENKGQTPAALKAERVQIVTRKGAQEGGGGGVEHQDLDFIIAPGCHHKIGGGAFGTKLAPFEADNRRIRVGYLFTYADFLGKEWTEVIWWDGDWIEPGKLGKIPLTVTAHREGPDGELLWVDDEHQRRIRKHTGG